MDQDNKYISRDRSCKEFSIEFSYVHPIQGSSLKSILRLLSCNTFLTNKGLFELQVIYFGLCNLLGIFQRIMNSIFQELLHEGVLANYMDNFVILAKKMKKLEEQMIRFLKIAEKHNLCFKRSKYNFNMKEIPILEVVGKEQVKMEQEKIKAVKEWKT